MIRYVNGALGVLVYEAGCLLVLQLIPCFLISGGVSETKEECGSTPRTKFSNTQYDNPSATRFPAATHGDCLLNCSIDSWCYCWQVHSIEKNWRILFQKNLKRGQFTPRPLNSSNGQKQNIIKGRGFRLNKAEAEVALFYSVFLYSSDYNTKYRAMLPCFTTGCVHVMHCTVQTVTLHRSVALERSFRATL